MSYEGGIFAFFLLLLLSLVVDVKKQKNKAAETVVGEQAVAEKVSFLLPKVHLMFVPPQTG